MKSFTTFAMFAGILMFTAVGCGDQAGTDTAPATDGAATAPTEEDHADHDHEDGDHEDGDHDHEDGE